MDSNTHTASQVISEPSISWLVFSRHLIAALIVSSIQPFSGNGLAEAAGAILGGLGIIFGTATIAAALATGTAALFLTETTHRVRKHVFLWALWISVLTLLLIVWLDKYSLVEFARPLLISIVALAVVTAPLIALLGACRIIGSDCA